MKFLTFFVTFSKIKLKLSHCDEIVHSIMSRMVFFYSSGVKIVRGGSVWVRPT